MGAASKAVPACRDGPIFNNSKNNKQEPETEKEKDKHMRIRKPTLAVLAIIAASALTITAVRAKAQGCGHCGPTGSHAGHDGHAGHATAAQAAAEPIASLLANYDRIQASLAGDSLAGVADAAGAIAKLAAGGPSKPLPAEIAAQAGALAQAQDLTAARESFKQLSASLISFLERLNVGTGHLVVYCDMAKASWLQKETTVRNPYYGKSMLKCGEVKKAI